MTSDPTSASFSFRDLIGALRPKQWTKNAIVFAAFFFALGDRTQAVPFRLLAPISLAAALFCVVSSAVYILNDIRDIPADRRHPVKRARPIPAGRFPLPAAWATALILLAVGLAAAAWLSRPFLLVLIVYVLLQVFYNLWLKQVPLVDIFVIAAGFVLRALAGGAVARVHISPWLVLCTLLLALFLVLCKRRHEKVLLDDGAEEHRPVLEQYDRRLLDQLIAIVSAATVVSYAIYTLWPDTVAKFGSARLSLTVPFVLFGVFRYLDLVYRHDQGGSPEEILLTDAPLLADIALYGITVICIFACRNVAFF